MGFNPQSLPVACSNWVAPDRQSQKVRLPCFLHEMERHSPRDTAPPLKPPPHAFVREIDPAAEHERTPSNDEVEATSLALVNRFG